MLARFNIFIVPACAGAQVFAEYLYCLMMRRVDRKVLSVKTVKDAATDSLNVMRLMYTVYTIMKVRLGQVLIK